MRILPILLVCPLMTGCLAYAYPSITQTPPINVNEPDVKAFRVTYDYTFSGAIIAGAFKKADSIQEIPVTDAEIPSQRDTYFAYHYLAFPFGGQHDRSVSVQLYRRGYEAVKVESRYCLAEGMQTRPITVEWKKVETLEAHEKAIDSLDQGVFVRHDTSFAEFLATEYIHLAHGQLTDIKARERLLQKAKRVRAKSKS